MKVFQIATALILLSTSASTSFAGVHSTTEDPHTTELKRTYKKCLGRDASREDLQHWRYVRVPTAVARICESSEAKLLNAKTINASYITYLNRTPSQAEVSSWLKTGESYTVIRNSIAYSGEASALDSVSLNSNLGKSEAAKLAFAHCLGRELTDDEINANWMIDRSSRRDLVNLVVFSNESSEKEICSKH